MQSMFTAGREKIRSSVADLTIHRAPLRIFENDVDMQGTSSLFHIYPVYAVVHDGRSDFVSIVRSRSKICNFREGVNGSSSVNICCNR